MREHQIVITLKPEQFMEVQRLSRAAGSKSMGMFVRQKLLAALGLDGSAAAAAAAAAKLENSANMPIVTAELKRLHGELRIFVAESLSKPYIEDTGPANGDDIADDLGEAEPAVPEEPESQIPVTEPEQEDPGDEAFDEMDDISKHLENAKDDLEQLAQKAFAISPRLGILETPGDLEELKRIQQERLKDPLGDILEAQAAAQPEQTQFVSSSGDFALLEEESEEFEGEEDEDVQVAIELPERPSRASREQPGTTWRHPKDDPPPPPPPPPEPPMNPSGPGGPVFSGGPPPRKRQ